MWKPTVRAHFSPRISRLTNLVRLRDTFAFQKQLDRYIGFIHWDRRSASTWIKLALLTFSCVFYTASCLCIGFINPDEVPVDHIFGMWFVVSAGCSCYSQWFVLAVERRHLSKIVEFLSNMQQRDLDHPTRVYYRPRILLFSLVLWATNFSQPVMLSGTLLFTSSIAHVINNSFLKSVAYGFFPLGIVLIGITANVAQINIFTAILVFAVEFEILGEDFHRAFNEWNVEDLKCCVVRHKDLLDMVILLRDKLKLYLLLTLQIYFLSITFSCVSLVIQLKAGDSEMLYSIINLLTVLPCLLLFGLICDILELRVAAVGDQVYRSQWVNCIAQDPSLKRNLLMVLMRSQKRINFKCGNIFDMSIATCVNVIRLCYSTFTLLMNLVHD